METYYMDKFAKRKALSDCIYEKLIETGEIRKCDAKRAANAVARPGIIQSIEELKKIMEKKNWYKDYRQIGKKSADILEKAFKDEEIETKTDIDKTEFNKTIDEIKLSKAIKDVSQWYNDFLPMLLMEECAELQQAVSKFERYWGNEVISESRERKLRGDITKAMADVFIMALAYCNYYGIEIEPNDIFKAAEKEF
jgi:NTP pyrophosphatase (non-canonical NTP hydrolase)